MIAITCPRCGASEEKSQLGTPLNCSQCGALIGVLAQLEQCLAAWYEPRRWRADLVQPNAYYLIERLWTANGQGEKLYRALSPRHTNFDIFRFTLTRLIASGLEAGWARLQFPPDPGAEDPAYHLSIQDPARFAREVEHLLQDVDWDEQIEVALGE